ncbi:hypothetical protein NPIL_132271 [Nephila pilipes]|uniref:Uncharacterized protein n=1 Tax=Nephila pilipes TaxID=299642 RepID=A0A8X6TV36_NEPPI|nr:hypothetical protein NPIL_132271 [Nephila pilipes]
MPDPSCNFGPKIHPSCRLGSASPRDAQPWERGESCPYCNRTNVIVGWRRHEHAPALSHPSHLSHVSTLVTQAPPHPVWDSIKDERFGAFCQSLFALRHNGCLPSCSFVAVLCVPDKTDALDHVVRQGL